MAGRRVQLPNEWRPRPYQQEAWEALENGVKRHALCWHRRAGKDDFAMQGAAVGAFERVGVYWHMLPHANQARKAIWDAVDETTGKRRIDMAFPREIIQDRRENDMFIRFVNGSTWQVVGSDNFDSLVGSPPVGLTSSEHALADPSAWDYLRPILANNNGWARFISTPRGRNHFSRMTEYAINDPEWFGQILTVDDTQAIPRNVIDRERRELAAIRGDAEAEAIIQQEYYCNFDAAIPGAYYGESMTRMQREGRIGAFPWLPNQQCATASDLGFSDSTVMLIFQFPSAGRIRIIDGFEGSGAGIDWYCRRLMRLPYQFAEHLWPHDGGHGNIRDVAGQTLEKTATSLGMRPIRIIGRDPNLADAINAVRQMLPLIEINTDPMPHVLDDGTLETPQQARERMQRIIDAMRQYRRVWVEKLQRYADEPLHDWTSHTADAFRTLARGRKPFRGTVSATHRPSQADTNYATLG